MDRLKQKYLERVRAELQKRLGYENIMQVPKLERLVVNIGVGDALSNPKLLEAGVEELGIIAGQRPVIRRAKKSISNFKLRAGMAIGASVTLRGRRMYEFFDRLVNVAIPRIRDFRGLPKKSFDGRGNYTLGLEEQIIFPEIDYDKVQRIRGMNVTIVTTAETDREAYELLKELGMPFREI
ncbi:MAG: 50S ribosomal protein L5 [candidate division Zixibacteria bacterium DG_27]|nr:MAG: 50S ribosomal protein L5 [candidate division Zixibacteria bacterium DG_27]